jgi:hypothetical protein
MKWIREFYKNIEDAIHSDTFPTHMVENYITITNPEEMFKHRHSNERIHTFIDKQIKSIVKLVDDGCIDYTRYEDSEDDL